jgi:AraC family transcriptional regulator, arabinose operon regulatory protein
MEATSMFMDFPFTDTARLSRRLTNATGLLNLGMLAGRCSTRRYRPETFNINLILHGTGFVRHAGQERRVITPAAFCAWPGELIIYGPDEPGHWHECYLNFAPEMASRWQEAGIADAACPLWPIRNLRQVEHRLAEIAALLNEAMPEAGAERLDRLVELLVFEARFARAPQPNCGPAARIAELRQRIERDLAHEWTVEDMAAACGEALSSFRRHWQEEIGIAPARYLAELRMREACRLLVEEDAPVVAIAATVGFSDPLYFSRRFRQVTGEAPSVYRQARRER